MNHQLSIKKGLDLKIAGAVANPQDVLSAPLPAACAIVPDDFPGFTPKVEVKDGDTVSVGSPLFHDKRDEDIKLVSPVAGTVKAVVRGERRKLERVVIEPAKSQTYVTLDEADPIRRLKLSGLWAMMRQRPYDVVPASGITPRDIFVTAIDSAPLAADPTLYYNDAPTLRAAVAFLSPLTSGKVWISRRPGSALADVEGAEMVDVAGPHPAGNVGTQIALLSPVNKGETVWTLNLPTLWRIGRLAIDGRTDATTCVAVTGSEVATPHVARTVIGAQIASLVADCEASDGCHHRIISGNVLTGKRETCEGFLRYPYTQLTIIPEGDDVDEFMGWASLSPKKMSQSRTFPGRLFRKVFNPDARLLGGRRALIMSGEYDKYQPMDIMSEYLLKAILSRDIERMEQLGIYEVAPEDFALGEWADTSKLEAQKIVREGLDYLRKELE